MRRAPGEDAPCFELELRGRSLEQLRWANLSVTLPVTQSTLSDREAVEWAGAEAERRGLVPIGEPRTDRVKAETVLGALTKWTWRVRWGSALVQLSPS
jgi:hypothetical protein